MMIYEKEYELRAADFDRWDRMQPASGLVSCLTVVMVSCCLFYYLFTELFLMVDSRAKNMFPSFMGSPVT